MEKNLKIPSELLEPMILAYCRMNPSFFLKAKKYLDTSKSSNKSYFSDVKYQTVFNLVSRFHEKRGDLPKLDTLKVLIDRIEKDQEIKLYLNSIADNMYEATPETIDVEYIEDETKDFIKKSQVFEAMMESQFHFQEGNYDAMVKRIEEAMTVNFDTDLGMRLSDIEGTMKKINELDSVAKISTGYPHFDSLLDGGFHPKEIYTLAAIPGGGKCIFSDVKIKVRYKIDTETGKIV